MGWLIRCGVLLNFEITLTSFFVIEVELLRRVVR